MPSQSFMLVEVLCYMVADDTRRKLPRKGQILPLKIAQEHMPEKIRSLLSKDYEKTRSQNSGKAP